MEVKRESLKLSLSNELTETAHLLSMEAHKHNQTYITNTVDQVTASSSSSMEVFIFAFPGAWGVNDWYRDYLFGEIDVDCNLLPSLRRIGENRLAQVNAAFLHRFQDLLNNSMFETEVEKAVNENKKILITGHSSGGAIASFATLWILDEYVKKRKIRFPIGCVTFGSPLIGDRTLSHAVRREKWSGHFTHVVKEHDIVPRIMLAPKSEHLPNILKFLQQILNPTNHESTSEGMDHDLMTEQQAVEFFENVMLNASTVTSHVAFNVMEPTNFLMDKLWADFVKISPYRPSGYYVFCNRDETLGPDRPLQQFVVENPNAVLQLLFYFLQLPDESQNLTHFVVNSIIESVIYKQDVHTENLVDLISLNDNLLTPNGSAGDVVHTISKALFDLSVSAKCCQMAAYEAEKRKTKNENANDKSMRRYKQDQSTSDRPRSESKIIEDILDEIRNYKVNHEDYYEAFKLQDGHEDFMANVKRLELANIWDVIVEMVMREDLPDEFEGRGEWVEVGTVFRRLVEPLDIANYYRHLKGDGYMYVRPKRYKFTQRWYEHANGTVFELVSESNFVARFEEIRKEIEETRTKTIEEVHEELESVEERIAEWFSDEKIRNEDVFWGESLLSMLQQLLEQQQHQEQQHQEEEEEQQQHQHQEEEEEEEEQQPQPQRWILFE